MQNFIAQSGLPTNILVPSKEASKDSAAVADKASSGDSSKDFVSILFEQIKNSAKKSTTTSDKSSLKTETSKISTISDNKSKSTSDLLLSEVLNIISLLKNDLQQTSFPKFSDKLQTILNKNVAIDKNTVLSDFKNVKNINDLIGLSKKYDLGLDNIKLSKQKITDLQKEFPKLDAKQFFKMPDSVENKILDTKATPNIIKNRNPIKNTQSATVTTQIIKNLDHNEVQNVVKNTLTYNLTQNIQDHKKVSTPIDSSVKINNTQDVPKNILQTLLRNIDDNTKKAITKNMEPGKIDKAEKPALSNLNDEDLKAQVINDKNIPKDVKPNNKISNIIQSQQKESADKKSVIKDLKAEQDINIIKTNKNDNLQAKQVIDPVANNHIKKDIQIKMSAEVVNSIQSQSVNSLHDESSKKNNETKNDSSTIHQKIDVKSPIMQNTAKMDKNVSTQDSLNQFATDLKEKIDNYKPPIMKLQLSINPKNLGSVDVVLLHRGNNLHVNITSNTNTMSLFTQNQAEFKNSLVNMGFTNLEMNFSDQSQGKNNQQKNGNKQKDTNTLENIQNQKSYDSTVELIVPQYI